MVFKINIYEYWNVIIYNLRSILPSSFKENKDYPVSDPIFFSRFTSSIESARYRASCECSFIYTVSCDSYVKDFSNLGRKARMGGHKADGKIRTYIP